MMISESPVIIHAMRNFTPPNAQDLTLERVLYALSDPVRLEIVRCLAGVPEASCGELDGGRPKSSMSHHFRVLRDAGLVQIRNVGTTHMNSLRSDVLESRFPGLLASILAQK
ncbi:ArsR/SmtB family transcription factor [Pseudomonas lijiangensis]|uniref:Helix-turn-helix domain-containing protein n=1 Tax=Pseudomonas lijiangensis TaxID=2995658 RepID=A0ABX8HKV5_9PSED|nr:MULTISPECIES: helix-turn-helix domain-containing protein [Pseudomonas syringae group]MBX8498389.1 helix-turn-helix domain-containing protein [Pseudomonas lijiangensis]MBX8503296.1 helix-turn-helix domain-containing protein [Pseudomonas lijiangensis]MBX8519003.1 helix-turn-helix domain-containing protein [Pseudomonas cichorii]MBX8552970.1 helix-turn-helix domain-containing protein [Pseudomonas cichorii]MBX8562837.1 helix-turn-helix domain-containing protein [Pseudomonas cichorii]